MQTLAEITDPREIDELKGQCMQLRPRSTTRAFQDIFKSRNNDWQQSEEEPTPQPRPMPATESPEPQTTANSQNSSPEFVRQLQQVRDRIDQFQKKNAS